MNRMTLPGMIRDLLTTGDDESRAESAEWLRGLIDTYAPQPHLAKPNETIPTPYGTLSVQDVINMPLDSLNVDPRLIYIHDLGTCYDSRCEICVSRVG